MFYLAIDPGKRTGWASFDEDGQFLAMGIIEGEDNFLDWLEQQEPRVGIIEGYRNRIGGKGAAVHAWSQNDTSQEIGAIKRIFKKWAVPLEVQFSSPCLPQGLRFLGVYEEYYTERDKLKKHVPDNISALAHGTYYLRKHRVI